MLFLGKIKARKGIRNTKCSASLGWYFSISSSKTDKTGFIYDKSVK